MKKSIILLFLSGSLFAGNLSITGLARNYIGVLLHGNNDYAIIQNYFNLNISESTDKIGFKVNPYIYQYPNNELNIGLREAYLDLYFPTVDLRVGKQQIIWGKADGVFITDIVSPKDFREFLLPDFDEIRIGITSLKADYYAGDNTLELVWVPVFTPDKAPDSGSIWSPKMPQFPVPTSVDYSRASVEKKLENSEIFGRLSAITGIVDFEIMGGYTWDDKPVMGIKEYFTMVDSEHVRLDSLTMYPEYNRVKMGGGSFSTTIGPFVLRGEGAYYYKKYFSTLNPLDIDGVTQKSYIQYLLGLDYTLWDWHLSGQFVRRVIFDYDDFMLDDEHTNMATFLVSKNFFNETLHLSLFTYYDIDNSASLIRPKISYDLADGFEVLIGANVFTGTKGMFGQFDNNDMVYYQLKYSF